ncbi:MAG: DUF885 domain-containing protein [Verrucomicrobiota bacterium]
MTFLLHLPSSILLCLCLALPATAATPSESLHALFAREWDYAMEQAPTWASELGDRRWNDRWEDLSLDAIARRHRHNQDLLAELQRLDRAKLPPADQLNYDLFRKGYADGVEGHQFALYLIPINQRNGIQTADELADSLRFETLKDYEDWLGRLRAFPRYLDQTLALLREGARTRTVLPKIVMQRVPAQIDKQIVEKPADSPFFKPFRQFPDSISAADRQRLVAAAQDTIGRGVIPAFRKLKEYFAGEYLPACFDEVGAWQLPQGERLYAFQARLYTTTSLTPQEIHELGLNEVKRIRAGMIVAKDKAGFKGSLPEFFQFLRTDPQFYYKTSGELLDGYRAISKRIDPHMVRLFKTLPRMPYGVEPIPDNVAPDTTTAYYRQPAADGSRAGTFFVNLYRPETRPKWEMMALSLHEAVPGHHLQIALAMEQGELPNFRRYGGYTAYVEGWGLYSEHLGEELGLYDDPYSKMGQLTYEMWRAVRLVVDTGMHYKKWTRQQAIDFFKDNAPKAENDIINEIDRYIAWPGQALAYKIGELKLKELRARAQRELGPRFDVKEFHDVILASGALPLDVLEERVAAWLARAKK